MSILLHDTGGFSYRAMGGNVSLIVGNIPFSCLSVFIKGLHIENYI